MQHLPSRKLIRIRQKLQSLLFLKLKHYFITDPNDALIEAADRTHNLIKRLGTRYEVIHRSAAAADFSSRYTKVTNEDHDRAGKIS